MNSDLTSLTPTNLYDATTNTEQGLSFSGFLNLVMTSLAGCLDDRSPKGKDNTNANAADTLCHPYVEWGSNTRSLFSVPAYIQVQKLGHVQTAEQFWRVHSVFASRFSVPKHKLFVFSL
jgi:hypothetical protein